jgi:hypothetical protein
MNTAGLILMITSVSVVLGWNAWCFYNLFRDRS